VAAALSPSADKTRQRIIAAATKLLARGGRDAVSTRAVSTAAGVQAPTIYRLFGDKQGLLDAVATHGFETHLQGQASLKTTDDPVEDLRAGWDQHVAFGLDNPELYSLIYGELRRGPPAPAAIAAAEALAGYVHRVAVVSRLRVSEERAAQLIHGTGRGITLTLISMPKDQRDMGLSEVAREAVIAAITTGGAMMSDPGPASAAVALRAVVSQTTTLTVREQGLLQEWLERIGDAR
jgi:AcrR family transcriptional regulator